MLEEAGPQSGTLVSLQEECHMKTDSYRGKRAPGRHPGGCPRPQGGQRLPPSHQEPEEKHGPDFPSRLRLPRLRRFLISDTVWTETAVAGSQPGHATLLRQPSETSRAHFFLPCAHRLLVPYQLYLDKALGFFKFAK